MQKGAGFCHPQHPDKQEREGGKKKKGKGKKEKGEKDQR